MQAAHPEDAENLKRYFITRMRVLGIRAPILRQLVNQERPALLMTEGEDVVGLGKALVNSQIFEARQFAYLMINANAHAMQALSENDLIQLGQGMDNWASVDTYSTLLSGICWRDGKIPDATIQNWTGSDNPWWRRAALVSTIPLNLKSRGGKGDLDRTLDISNRLKGDPDRMVRKALSWALRELSKRYPKEVYDFLEVNRQTIPIFIRHEVMLKLSGDID
jgi:3-methyladenine DNA glycosylase AlkD